MYLFQEVNNISAGRPSVLESLYIFPTLSVALVTDITLSLSTRHALFFFLLSLLLNSRRRIEGRSGGENALFIYGYVL